MSEAGRDTAWRWLVALAGQLAGWVVLAILAGLAFASLPLLRSPAALTALLSPEWAPFAGAFGIGSMLAGSVALATLAVGLAWPTGILLALHVQGLGSRWLARPLDAALRLMAGMPTIVYAFVSVALLVPYLRDELGIGNGYSWLAGSLTLGLMLTPTVYLTLAGPLARQDRAQALACDALGLTVRQRLLWISLPSCRPTLLAALLLASGRAVGDTLIALMVTGNTPLLPAHPGEPLRALTAHIAMTLTADTQSQAYASIFAASLLLLVYVGCVQALGRRILSHASHH
ncbi:ABC transporter permease subunit [Laribacter hongkongensis]|uniref:PstC family ABC transporter permease n=1 Tax=Laribacter hongkongensis TaxID=168471 RepID=UPI001EFCD297|nr:ABC transporter permease subunit [Laribacter hongkongensis]MCG9059496.1 ABC transporter permease subunit [Laribacter hongkongensis]MCG9086951.1 ABC transporter permease subunit [Laribacter hongkongensis]